MFAHFNLKGSKTASSALVWKKQYYYSMKHTYFRKAWFYKFQIGSNTAQKIQLIHSNPHISPAFVIVNIHVEIFCFIMSPEHHNFLATKFCSKSNFSIFSIHLVKDCSIYLSLSHLRFRHFSVRNSKNLWAPRILYIKKNPTRTSVSSPSILLQICLIDNVGTIHLQTKRHSSQKLNVENKPRLQPQWMVTVEVFQFPLTLFSRALLDQFNTYIHI